MARGFQLLHFTRLLVLLLTALLSAMQLRPALAANVGELATEEATEDWLLEARLDKAHAYPYERIGLTVTFLVGRVAVRNIQYPRLQRTAFDLGEFAPPIQTNQSRNGRDYIAHEFTATLVPRGNGRIEVGPVELGFDLLAPPGGATAYFGASEPRAMSARSRSLSLTILPLPTWGRPADFSGAVGQYRVARDVSPKAIRSGDAVTLTTRIQGSAAATRFPCTSVDLPGTRAYPTRTRRSGDSLVCEQVLLVDADTDLAIPAAHITFFDPQTGRYDTAHSAVIQLKVAPPLRNANVRTAAPPATPPDPTGEPAAGPWWYALIGLPLLAAGLILAFRRKRRAVAGHGAGPVPSLLALERALDESDSGRFYTEAYSVAQQVAAWRLSRSSAGITAANLESASEFSGAMAVLAELMHECDAVRYGNARRNPLDMKRHHQLLRAALQDAL